MKNNRVKGDRNKANTREGKRKKRTKEKSAGNVSKENSKKL